MRNRLVQRFDRFWAGYFPERRVFLKSDEDTRFIRLRPSVQALMFSVVALVLAWTIIATSVLVMDNIGAGNFREQSLRDQESYQQRLQSLAQERDIRMQEASNAQRRFNEALEQVSVMQTELLQSELRRREMADGLSVLQSKLRSSILSQKETDAELASLKSAIENPDAIAALNGATMPAQATENLAFLTQALSDTTAERDRLASETADAIKRVDELEQNLRLTQDRNEQIFRQIEDAMSVSIEPLNKIFSAAGVNPDNVLKAVRRGYSGYGGPLTALAPKKGETNPDYDRAAAIMKNLDELNIYRIAIGKLPVAMPVKNSFRYTSGYGRRWGRMHEGVDLAGAHGSPIYATADGVVVHAGWSSGYGRLIKIKHDFGLETRYGHLSKIRVKVGQKVSRGTQIGDMGNTGRSTGTHLHYEVRVNGSAVNPMKYLKAANDVF